MLLSERINKIHESPIRKFNPIALREERSGKKIYWLNIGQPDIETPKCFMDAIRNFDEPVLEYAQSQGYEPLNMAICSYYEHYGIDLDPEDMIITTGGSEALSFAFECVLDDGDKVMTAEPFYTNYRTFAGGCGAGVKPIMTGPEEGYFYADRRKLEEAYDDSVKAILCTNPGNPTGVTLSPYDMDIIGEFARDHDLWIISDEVYREFCYDSKPNSFAMKKDLADRLIIIDSISKRFSACGARIGALISKNKELIAAALKLAQGRLCTGTLDQIGAAELFKLPASYYDAVRAEYMGRRDAFYEEIMKAPGVLCEKPGGAFYMTIKLPVDNAEGFLMFMLTEFTDNNETVMFTPAESFYGTPGRGKDEIRIAYVLKKEDVRRAAELLRMGLEVYNK
ncbi:MAG: pyridoxal phosphate-dependent aminotransferase [Anaerovoracaceae bacterium]